MNIRPIRASRVFTLTLLCLPLLAVAQQSGVSKIETLARNFWSSGPFQNHNSYIKSTLITVEDKSYYVVLRTEPETNHALPGYLLVSSDEQSPLILAYDNQAVFPATNLPKHISSWISAYDNMHVGSGEDSAATRAWLAASRSSYEDVAPLLGQREWGQDNPYNLYCPTIDGRHCPTGCVATALAQIMCQHQWPIIGTDSINYLTQSNKQEIHFNFSNTQFEWDKMEDIYSPVVDTGTEMDTVTTNSVFFLDSISVDENSVPFSKCYVNIRSLTINGASSFVGETLLVLTDDSCNFTSRATAITNVESRFSGKILNDKSFLLYVPVSLPDGTYRIYNATRAEGDSIWHLSKTRNDHENYITLNKEVDLFTIGGLYFPCSPTTEGVQPIATLLQAVGAAVEMDYKIDSSGSTDALALKGLISYLGYDSDMFFAEPENYTDAQWHQMLQRELSEGRPVYYTGQGGLQAGHAFVIDGFKTAEDSTKYYHVNWGWDGLCNGYYLLNMLRPSSAGTGGSSGTNYSTRPSMLIGMKPDNGISEKSINCQGLVASRQELFAGQLLPLRISLLTIQSSTDFEGTIRLELHPIKDSVEYDSIAIYSSPISITAKRGLKDFYMTCPVPIDTPTDNYFVKLVFTDINGNMVRMNNEQWPQVRVKGKEEWTGGLLTQPLQRLAIGGNVAISTPSENGVVTLTIDSVANPTTAFVTGQVAIVICDADGGMMTFPEKKINISVGSYNVKRDVSISSTLSRNIPDGNYSLRIGFLPSEDTLWTFCDLIKSEGLLWWADYAPFLISMSLTDGMVKIADSIEFEGADTPWITGISAVGKDARPDEEFYDLHGRKIIPTRRGFYIKKTGGKVTKIVR